MDTLDVNLFIMPASVPPDPFFQNVIIKWIMQSVTQNSPPISPEDATPFHALSVPEITVQEYLERFLMNMSYYILVYFVECSNICFVLVNVMFMH
jgi:hypothetical protein